MSKTEKLVIERTIEAPVARVWRALTDGAELKQWLSFFPDFKPEVGFQTEFDLGRDAEHQMRHIVKVLEVVERQKLTYTWDYGGMSPNSTITFELSGQDNVTQLILTCHIDPLPADEPDFMKSATFGWNYTADSLKQFSEK